MKTGLVLEGGAMRGMYTSGVLDIFLKQNIHFDAIIGVSAGALFGVNYLSGQQGRVIRYNKRFNSDKNYMGLRILLKTGNLVNTEYAYHKVPHELDIFDNQAFINSGIPFYAVVTNINTGMPEYIKIDNVFEQMDVLRASGSMPFVSTPVMLGDQYYLDGGISDSIPFEKLIQMGYDKIIVILTRDMNYIKKSMPKLPISVFYRKFPALKKRLKLRHEVYNNSIAKLKILESKGSAFVIRPSEPIKIKRTETDPDLLQSVYDLGIKDAENIYPELLKYMKS